MLCVNRFHAKDPARIAVLGDHADAFVQFDAGCRNLIFCGRVETLIETFADARFIVPFVISKRSVGPLAGPFAVGENRCALVAF